LEEISTPHPARAGMINNETVIERDAKDEFFASIKRQPLRSTDVTFTRKDRGGRTEINYLETPSSKFLKTFAVAAFRDGIREFRIASATRLISRQHVTFPQIVFTTVSNASRMSEEQQ